MSATSGGSVPRTVFCKQKRAYDIKECDWSSDVCSSDLSIAHVAEVSVSKKGEVRVHRVVCAIDCGPTVNPDTIRAQMEGAVVFGLTAALYGQITFEKGRVQQRNFHDY